TGPSGRLRPEPALAEVEHRALHSGRCLLAACGLAADSCAQAVRAGAARGHAIACRNLSLYALVVRPRLAGVRFLRRDFLSDGGQGRLMAVTAKRTPNDIVTVSLVTALCLAGD